jgi:hypothetical protein
LSRSVFCSADSFFLQRATKPLRCLRFPLFWSAHPRLLPSRSNAADFRFFLTALFFWAGAPLNPCHYAGRSPFWFFGRGVFVRLGRFSASLFRWQVYAPDFPARRPRRALDFRFARKGAMSSTTRLLVLTAASTVFVSVSSCAQRFPLLVSQVHTVGLSFSAPGLVQSSPVFVSVFSQRAQQPLHWILLCSLLKSFDFYMDFCVNCCKEILI